eukprot:2304164-Pyramimonas_sp.AAC.1
MPCTSAAQGGCALNPFLSLHCAVTQRMCLFERRGPQTACMAGWARLGPLALTRWAKWIGNVG